MGWALEQVRHGSPCHEAVPPASFPLTAARDKGVSSARPTRVPVVGSVAIRH